VHKHFSNPAVNAGAPRKTKEKLRTCKEATKEKDLIMMTNNYRGDLPALSWDA